MQTVLSCRDLPSTAHKTRYSTLSQTRTSPLDWNSHVPLKTENWTLDRADILAQMRLSLYLPDLSQETFPP